MTLNTMWLQSLLIFITLTGFGSGSEFHFGPCVIVINGACPDPNIKVFLYTRSNQDVPQYVHFNASSDNLTTSFFDPKRSNKLIIHGYNADMFVDSLMEIKKFYGKDVNLSELRCFRASVYHSLTPLQRLNEYLKQGDYNVWMVNWPSLCKGPCYPFAVYNLGHVGQCLSQLILALRRRVALPDLHVIGFSLGAHVGNYLALSLAPYKIPRITGLDPAMPLFFGREKDRKLDKSDALFVDVIHTNSFIQGNVEEAGHVDFYVNGGVNQPGCRNDSNPFACDHNRAPEYFAESVTTQVGFLSWSCAGFLEYVLGECKPKYNMVPMGENCPNSTRGFYVTYTAGTKPFALGPWTGARFKTFNFTTHFNTSVEDDATPPTVEVVV